MKKIGVVSDTHILGGRGRLPDAVIRGFDGVDLILHAGDMVHFSVLEELELIAPVKAVRGNCDMMPGMNPAPEKRIFKVGQVRIGMIHSLGAKEAAYCSIAMEEFGERAGCVVFGHSHKPYNEYRNGMLFFNPGSAGDRRNEKYLSYGILEVDADRISRNEIVYF